MYHPHHIAIKNEVYFRKKKNQTVFTYFLSVQSGATDELRRFVYDLGVYVLTTLADTGAWVLAYQLLKTFKVYGQYNTCAFALLSAEIYIANHRPLKALAILKRKLDQICIQLLFFTSL